MHLPKAKAISHMPQLFSLARLQLLLLILLRCRLCAARNDPGGRQAAAGVHLPTWKLCLLLVALAVAAMAAAAALIVFACRRRSRNASVAVAVAPAPQNRERKQKQVDQPNQGQWSAYPLWSSMSPRNPMSINPTMVPSAQTTPSPNWRTYEPVPPPSGERPSYSTIFADLATCWRRSRHPPPGKVVAPPLRPGPPEQAASPVGPGLHNMMVIQDPLARYSPARWVTLTHLRYDQLESGTNTNVFKRKSLPGGGGGRGVGPWNVVLLEDTHRFVEENGLPAKVTIKRHCSAFTEEDCKRIREELKSVLTLRHKNLVKLYGYTLGKGRLYLVYDYMSLGSLEDHLFPVNGVTALDWQSRYKIAKDVAQGLDPLHESNIPHGSISLSSIMLDHGYIASLDDHFNYRPYMSKSGTSSATTQEESGAASLEADIADLGAVFLELVCGRRHTDTDFSQDGKMTLVDWVWALYGEAYKEPDDVGEGVIQRRVNEDRLFGAVDSTLNGEISKAQASKLLILGLACSRPDSKMRPTIRGVRLVLLDMDPVPQLPLSKPTCT